MKKHLLETIGGLAVLAGLLVAMYYTLIFMLCN
jgi:hypothetical protein